MQTVVAGLNFDVTLKVRVPGDIPPHIHAFARRRGLSASAWIRTLIFDALAAEHDAPADEQCQAA